ncbi:MAG: alpha-N-acetylglucosaminidase C-terminal domain-containing protein [Planctomycetes bacterium]|nr:alpha-N-acetylglucosaminidase C-terminal domain-containing protein [Planctomycetota bacterium]
MKKDKLPSFTVVHEGKPHSILLLGQKATATEKHAAGELSRYVEQMSGVRLPIAREGGQPIPTGHALILIGRPETHHRIQEHVRRGAVRLTNTWPGTDGFIIKTLDRDLVLGGSRDRGTLYAVYQLLEKFLHVGFFWDGDHVPRMNSIRLPKIDISERPRFRLRFSFDGGCAAGYSFGSLWGFEEWKTEIDWLMKNKFNAIIPNIGMAMVGKIVEERMGLGQRPIPEKDLEAMRFARRIFDYLRTLDMDAITPIPTTGVTVEFERAHPQSRYFRQGWFCPQGDATEPTLSPNLFPTDPLYRKLVETYVRCWTEIYGTWHLYTGSDPYSESSFNTSPEERNAIMISLPLGVMAGIQAADPEGIWVFNDWGWVFNYTCAWSKKVIQGFLRNVNPPEKAIAWCQGIEWTPRPICEGERVNYYRGLPFALAFLNEFGGDDYLHGNIPKSIETVQRLAGDRKAANCCGIGIATEVLRYNVHYYDFITRLAWQPGRIDYSKHLADVALRRYGAQNATRGGKALRTLADVVYTDWVTSSAMYQHRMYPHMQPLPNYPIRFMPMSWSVQTARRLEKFFDAVLPVAASLRDQECFGNDLVDAFRQYATELFNAHFLALDEAFAARDERRFDRHASAMLFILSQVEGVLSSRPSCRVEDLARSLARHRRNPRLAAMRETLRKNLSFATSYPTIIDYGSRDFYEVLRFYWRPRVQAFLQLTREKMRKGEKPGKEELDKLYRPIELAWDTEGYPKRQAQPYDGPMWHAVTEAYAALQSNPDVKLRPSDVAVKVGPPDHLGILSGNNQRGLAGQKLPVPLAVKLCDKDGNGIGGFMGTMEILRGAGQLTSVAFTTDLDGIARGEYTPGSLPGRHRISALAVRGRGPVFFNFDIRPPEARKVTP